MASLKSHSTLLLFLISYVVMLPLTSFAQEYAPGEIIVKLKKGKTESQAVQSKAVLEKFASQKRMVVKANFPHLGMHHLGLRKGQTVDDALSEMKVDPDVEFAEPNYYFRKTEETGLQQSFTADEVQSLAINSEAVATGASIGLQNIWNLPTSGISHPVVAIIDTGVDTQHSVLQKTNALWVNPGEIAGNGIDDEGNGYIDDINGYNFVANNGNPIDDDGHGTHIAGIILSVDQDIFSSSLRPAKVQIMALKFMDSSGVGKTSDAIRAINYAIQNGAVVINNSWGGSSYSIALRNAIANSYSHGTVFVASAGNSGSDNDISPTYPAAYDIPNVISVAASDDQDRLATFSNFGAHSVALASPGVAIMSLLPSEKFGKMSGTSMASPFVAGTAAQMKTVSPAMLGYQIKQLILSQTIRANDLNGRVLSSGRLAPFDAISAAATSAPEPSQPSFESESAEAERAPASSNSAGGCATKGLESSNMPISSITAIVVLFMIQIVGVVYLRSRAKAGKKRKESQG